MDHLARQILRDVALEQIAPKAVNQNSRNPMDHWSPVILLERGAYLKKLARFGDGSASETLRDFPQHQAILSFLSRNGEAELHQKCAHLFCVLAGDATFVTGETVTYARPFGCGEMRGDAIEGGTRRELKAGDIAHVPAGVAYQMLVAMEKTVTCFVMKIKEAE